MNKDDIKSYIVKLKLEGYYKGSGVIVKSTNENFYIFTAKHNFAYDNDAKENVEKIKLESIKYDIKFNKIKIIEPYPNIKISDVIGLEDIYVDFVVLVIDKENSKGLEELPKKPLVIYNGNFSKSIIFGYPKVRRSSIEEFECKSKSHFTKREREENGKHDYKYIFEAKSKDKLSQSMKKEMDTISGISGGGAFLKYSFFNKYLVGIEIEYEAINSLICVNLKTIIGEINKKLKDDEIKVVKYRLRDIIGLILFIIFLIGLFYPKSQDISDESKNFTLIMQRLYEKPLLNVKFFYDKECRQKLNNDNDPHHSGIYKLSEIQIKKGSPKTIYMQNELIHCRPLELETNLQEFKFNCDKDCNDSLGECAYSHTPICERK